MKQFYTLRSFFLAAALSVVTFSFTSCEDEPKAQPTTETEVRGPYDQKGVFIINEGNFGTPSGSISFLSDSTGHTVQNEIFKQANNNRPLGDVVQDMVLFEGKALIVANNSNKLEIVNAYTFKTEGIVPLKQPRYVAVLSKDKAYVTEWVQYGTPGQVSVINLGTQKVIKTITVGQQPEQLKIVNGKLYVAVSGENKIVVIDPASDTIERSIPVADSPRELETDIRSNLWVLSAGTTAYNPDWSVDYTKSTAGALTSINTLKSMVTGVYTFDSNQSSPNQLATNGAKDKLYFTYQGKTYVQRTSSNSLDNTVVLDRSFSGLAIDPDTDYIYGSDNNGFAGNGTVFVYKPDGTKVNEFKVGIGPNGFVFN